MKEITLPEAGHLFPMEIPGLSARLTGEWIVKGLGEWRREQVLFGDTTDKDRPSARGEEREWRCQRGGGEKLGACDQTGLYLKRHLLCSSRGSL